MKVAITNTGKNTMYVGTASIPSGETRHVDPAYLPVHMRPKQPKPAAAMPGDPLDELLSGGVKSIIAAIPGLSINDLERLGELEQKKGDGARKTLLSSIAEALLDRASTDDLLKNKTDEDLSGFSDEALTDALNELESAGDAADPADLAAVKAEIERRATILQGQ